jgi:hypothetical protein
MLVFDHSNSPGHSRWATICAASFLVAFALYSRYGELLDGGTVFGLSCGAAATSIILFVSCYALRRRRSWQYRWVDRLPKPVRKPLYLTMGFVGKPWVIFRRTFDRKPTHVRFKQHIWLGLISVPVVYLHCGPRWGSAISSVVFVLYVIVIISGVSGLLLQHVLPRLLRLEVPSEAIHSQIPRILDDLRREADLLIRATSGPVDFGAECGGEAGLFPGRRPSPLLATIRDHRKGYGVGLLEHTPCAPVAGSECLLRFYEQDLRPFLADGVLSLLSRASYVRVARLVLGGNTGVLSSPTLAKAEFFKLRGKLDPAAYGVVDALERICDRRRQLAHQARLHTVLHSWLLIHVPAAAALLVALAAHIFYGIKFLMII